MMLNNKRGSIQDVLFFVVILLFFGFISLIFFYVYGQIDVLFQASTILPTTAKTASTSMLNHYTGIIDNSMLFLAIGLALASIALASLVRIHVIFLPFYVIALFITTIISGVASNIYQKAAENSVLLASADQLTFISAILNYLPLLTAIIGIIIMVVLYKTWSNAENA